MENANNEIPFGHGNNWHSDEVAVLAFIRKWVGKMANGVANKDYCNNSFCAFLFMFGLFDMKGGIGLSPMLPNTEYLLVLASKVR